MAKIWTRCTLVALCLLLLGGCSLFRRSGDKAARTKPAQPATAAKAPKKESPFTPGRAAAPPGQPAQQPPLFPSRGAVAAGPPSPLDYRGAMLLVAEKVRSLFPQVEGYVLSVKEDRLYLSLSQREEVQPKTQLLIFRQGQPFRHPLTGEILGHLEEELGRVEVLEVRERYSEGKVLSKRQGYDIQPGDKVRLTAARIRIAVAPLTSTVPEAAAPPPGMGTPGGIDTEGLTATLVEGLKQTGRFDLLEQDNVRVRLLELGIKPQELPQVLADPAALRRRWGGPLPVDYLLVSSLRPIPIQPETRIVDFRLVALEEGRLLRAESTPVPPARPGAVAATPQQPLLPTPSAGPPASSINPQFRRAGGGGPLSQEGLVRSQRLPLEVQGLAAGDVNGDGRTELAVIADPNLLMIYRWQEGNLAQLYALQGEGLDRYVAVDVADINRNGIAEIYVTSIRSGLPFSFVLEYRAGQFQKIASGQELLFRVLERPGKEPLLLGQASSHNRPFYGEVHTYQWQGAKLVRTGTIPLPDGLNLYGVTLWDLNGDGQEKVVAIGEDDRLRWYSANGRLQWKSGEYFGGTVVYFKHASVTPEQEATESAVRARTPIRSRILLRDLERNGTVQVILPSNIAAAARILPGLGFNDAQFVGLGWDGVGLSELWRSRNTNGYVADYAIADVDGDGREELVAAVVRPRGSLQGDVEAAGTSTLLFYELR